MAVGLPSRDATGVVIVNSQPDPVEKRQLRRLLDAGGGILADVRSASGIWDGIGGRRTHIRYIVPDDTRLFRNVGLLDLDLPGRLPSHAAHGLTDQGHRAVYAGPLGQGRCVVLPFEPSRALADRRSRMRVFAAQGPRPVAERVSTVNRGDIRRLVANALRFLLEQQDLPYVHLGYTPEPGLFGFRVDTDFGPLGTVKETLNLSARTDMAFTWFVNTGAHGNQLGQFRSGLPIKQDIQTHCHDHTLFESFAANHANMCRAKNLLAEHGFDSIGAAAPYGEWNEAWNRALVELDYQYSSDYAVGYDDLPFRPVTGGQPSTVLQIPVHPIAPSSLLAARMSEDDIVRYFAGYIQKQNSRGEPGLLYGHPVGIARLAESMHRILMYGRAQCGSTQTLTEFMRWWNMREKAAYELACDRETLTVTPQSETADLPLTVEFRERIAHVALTEQRLCLSAVNWQIAPRVAPFNRKVLAVRRSSAWRMRVRDLIRKLRRRTYPERKE